MQFCHSKDRPSLYAPLIKTLNCQITLSCSPPGFQYPAKTLMADYFAITLRLRIYHVMIEPCVRTARIIMNYVLLDAISQTFISQISRFLQVAVPPSLNRSRPIESLEALNIPVQVLPFMKNSKKALSSKTLIITDSPVFK